MVFFWVWGLISVRPIRALGPQKGLFCFNPVDYTCLGSSAESSINPILVTSGPLFLCSLKSGAIRLLFLYPPCCLFSRIHAFYPTSSDIVKMFLILFQLQRRFGTHFKKNLYSLGGLTESTRPTSTVRIPKLPGGDQATL